MKKETRMKKRFYLTAVILLLLMSAMPSSVSAELRDAASVDLDPSSPFRNDSFFGIWIGAADELKDATAFAYNVPAEIGIVQIFLSSDWSNLDPVPHFVVTAGMYASRPEAETTAEAADGKTGVTADSTAAEPETGKAKEDTAAEPEKSMTETGPAPEPENGKAAEA